MRENLLPAKASTFRGDHPNSSSFDVFRLKSLRPFRDCEFYAVPFLQRFVSIAEDCGIMNEDVASRSALNESKSLLVVEPFYLS